MDQSQVIAAGVGQVVIVIFCCGLFLGFLSSIVKVWLNAAEIANLRRRLGELDEEIYKLKRPLP